MYIPKTKAEYLMYAMQNYDSGSISILDFRQDMRVFGKIEKTIEKHLNDESINVRLLLNMIIVSFNQFGPAAIGLMFHKMGDHQSKRDILCDLIEFIGRADQTLLVHRLNTDCRIRQQLSEI